MVVKGDPGMGAELEAVGATSPDLSHYFKKQQPGKNTYGVNVLRGDLHIWKVELKPL